MCKASFLWVRTNTNKQHRYKNKKLQNPRYNRPKRKSNLNSNPATALKEILEVGEDNQVASKANYSGPWWTVWVSTKETLFDLASTHLMRELGRLRGRYTMPEETPFGAVKAKNHHDQIFFRSRYGSRISNGPKWLYKGEPEELWWKRFIAGHQRSSGVWVTTHNYLHKKKKKKKL
jgi:hypothetical protein